MLRRNKNTFILDIDDQHCGINKCCDSSAKDFTQSMTSVLWKAKRHLLVAQNRQNSYVDTKNITHSWRWNSITIKYI